MLFIPAGKATVPEQERMKRFVPERTAASAPLPGAYPPTPKRRPPMPHGVTGRAERALSTPGTLASIRAHHERTRDGSG